MLIHYLTLAEQALLLTRSIIQLTMYYWRYNYSCSPLHIEYTNSSFGHLITTFKFPH